MSEERTPPERVRITGLQESQLEALVELDRLCSNQYWEAGFDAAEVPQRQTADFVRLTRDHDVYVAEADDEVAGILAWKDEAPGVAYLADVSVHPELQRFGIGTKLLLRLHERAREVGLHHVLARCWEKATWATSFYEKAGFQRVGEGAPTKIAAWERERKAAGRPVTRPGEILFWQAVPPPPPEPAEEEPPAE